MSAKPPAVEPLEERALLSTTPTARLVADLNRSGPGSNPAQFVELNGAEYFVAGLERSLYRSDGTPAGTTRILQGAGGIYDPIGLTSINGRLLFDGWSATGGHELWTSDGTAAGTHQVMDIFPGAGGSDPRDFVSLNGITYFSAVDYDPAAPPPSTKARNLWRTDGTAAGTWKVRQLHPTLIANDPGPYGFFAFKNWLYFAYDDGGGAGYEIWRTDGTSQNTGVFTEIRPGAAGAFDNRILPRFSQVGADAFVFRALSPAGTLELYRSDGTAAGTRLVRGFGAGPAPRVIPTNVDSLVAGGPGGDVYFVGTNGTRGGLYRTNGTEDGTLLVNDDWDPGDGSGTFNALNRPNPLVPAAGQVFFTAGNSTTGEELWVTDGTRAGTHLVKDINPGSDTAFPYNSANLAFPEFAVRGNEVFFSAKTLGGGVELYRSDGTANGTLLVHDINPGYRDAAPSGMLVTASGSIFFSADDGVGGREPWVSDGTDAGTKLVSEINATTYSSNPRDLFSVGGTLIFAATTGAGDRLFASDGTAAGTVAISTQGPGGSNGFSYRTAAATHSLLYYVANDAAFGTELWRSDGTVDGTYRLTDINPGPASSMASVYAVASLGERCLFIADAGDGAGPQLWTANGTPAGTHKVAAAAGPMFTSDPRFTEAGGALYFTDASGFLWRSDGTDSGTWRIQTAAGPVSPAPGDWAAYKGSLYFQASDDAHGPELWRTDGTPAGTHIVADVWPGPDQSNPQSLAVSGSYLYFAAYAPDTTELWRTDGTAAGTVAVKNFGEGYTFCLPSNLIDVGGTLVFNVPTWEEGVWRSTGTTASTTKLSGPDIGGPSAMTDPIVVGKTAYYYYGQGIYYTDGTSAGSGQVLGTPAQLAPSSSPNFQLDGNGSLFFQLGDPNTGGELWVIPNAKAPAKPLDLNADPPPAPAAPALAGAAIYDTAPALAAAAAATTGIRLTWTPGTDMNGYRVQRSTSSTFATIDATWPVNANFNYFNDTTATAPAIYYYRLIAYNPAGDSPPATITVDRLPPAVIDANFLYLTGKRRISIRFGEDVSASLQAADLVVRNLTTNADLPTAAATLSWDAPTLTATWTFNSLADANYRATLQAVGVTDAARNTLTQDRLLNFSFMNADVNQDLKVDFLDLAKLAQNYNSTGGKTYGQGDFNGDGNVDFLDLAILAQRYNTGLAAPGAAQPAAAAAPSTSFAADWAAVTATGTAPTITAPVVTQADPKKLKPKPVFSVTPVTKPAPLKPKVKAQRQK